MAEARYLLRPGDDAYGRVCPECASPKHRQSQRCAACYYAARRRGEYPPPPVPKRRTSASVRAGGSRGRPQPQSHPWRSPGKEADWQRKGRPARIAPALTPLESYQ